MRKTSLQILFCTIALFLAGCGNEQNGETSVQAIPVIASPPVVKDLTVYLDSIGTLQPKVSLEIRPQVNGQLAKVLVSEGEWVKEGTPLFQIDPKPYAIKVQEAEAQLAMDLADARAVQMKLKRFQELAKKDLVAQTEWDDLNAQAQRSEGAVQLDEARLHAAKLDLERCTISSPVEGRVGKLDVHPGILVYEGQGESLAKISQWDPLMVEFTVTEKEFPQLPQDIVSIQIASLCGSELCAQGTATFFDNQFDSKTGLLLIRGTIPNADHALRPGQSVKVQIPVSVTEKAKLIPQKAIRYNQEGPYVYVVQADQTVVSRPLLLGEEHEKDQIVLEGLVADEIVVIDGHLRLSPGSKVEIKS